MSEIDYSKSTIDGPTPPVMPVREATTNVSTPVDAVDADAVDLTAAVQVSSVGVVRHASEQAKKRAVKSTTALVNDARDVLKKRLKRQADERKLNALRIVTGNVCGGDFSKASIDKCLSALVDKVGVE